MLGRGSKNLNMSLIPLVELTRNHTLENQHYGAVAVVNFKGDVIASAGDAHWLTFTRSTLKPLQALPFMQSGGDVAMKFDTRDIAMICASHNGEDMHVQQVNTMLSKVGLPYQKLECGCHVPMMFSFFDKPAPQGLRFDERYNNCSGKHAGFMAACVHQGYAVQGYTLPEHPLQCAIRRDVARAVGMDEAQMQLGIDGCSAPNYAMPLAKLAYGFARLASGAKDAEFGASFEKLSHAMRAHPELVSGTGRNDEAFMRIGRGDWVSKVGAEAVQVIASVSRGEAIALKVIDGNKQALYAATVEVMEQRGWLDNVQRDALEPWRARVIMNARKLVVGERKTVFKLQSKPA
jgi:L-asparaginase II